MSSKIAGSSSTTRIVSPSPLRTAAGSAGGQVGDREVQSEGGADAFLGADADGPAGFADDPVDSGQTEAAALADGLGREERLEDVRDDIGAHAGSRVAHRELDELSRADLRVQAGVVLVEFGGACLDGQRAAAGHRVAGVDGEVQEDLLHLAPVCSDPGQVRCQLDPQLDVLTDASGQQVVDIGDDGVELEGLPVDRAPPPEEQQLVGQPSGSLGGGLDLLDVGPAPLVCRWSRRRRRRRNC